MTSLNSQTFGLPFVKPIKMFRSRSARFLKTTYFSKGHDDRDKRTWGTTIE